MVRTVNEEKCMICGRVTNYYDPCLGRYCPSCCKGFVTEMVMNRCAMDGVPFVPEKDDKPSEPLIDHSCDIDAHLQKGINRTVKKR